MIQPLRKWHRRIVLTLGVLLPVLFVGGIRARHVRPSKKRALRTNAEATTSTVAQQGSQAESRGVGK